MKAEISVTMEPWEARGLIQRLEELKHYERQIVRYVRTNDLINPLLSYLNNAAVSSYDEGQHLRKAAKKTADNNIAEWKSKVDLNEK